VGCDGGAIVIYLDTHVVVWLYAGQLFRIPESAQGLMEAEQIRVSPMVVLELEYLHEIGRLTVGGATILESLASSIGLQVCALPFHRVAVEAMGQSWTRDPFDRIIAAHALCADAPLLTKDAAILANCRKAVWEV
jgi:PIN domain nuclease of toxin-antitoxin system